MQDIWCVTPVNGSFSPQGSHNSQAENHCPRQTALGTIITPGSDQQVVVIHSNMLRGPMLAAGLSEDECFHGFVMTAMNEGW